MAAWQDGQEGQEGPEGQEAAAKGRKGSDADAAARERRAEGDSRGADLRVARAADAEGDLQAARRPSRRKTSRPRSRELKQDYERPGGLQLVEVAGGYQIVTRPDLHEWVRRLFHERTTQKLTVQALETLAVIAYRQPITAAEITEIRGVNTSGVLNTLLERHLIKIVGRKQVVGRPFLYATTKEFLIRFGLNDLTDLPKVEDMAEALGFEAPLLVEQTPREEDAAARASPDAEETPGEDRFGALIRCV